MKIILLLTTFFYAAVAYTQAIPDTPPEARPNNWKADTTSVYKNVQIEPSFQGNWVSFLQANLAYPEKAISKKIQGIVIIDFIVERDGRVVDLKVAPESPQKNNLLVKESIRVLKLTEGNWKPGMLDGKAVRTYHAQKFNYSL